MTITTQAQLDARNSVAHIKAFEIYTTDGNLHHILSTADSIKQYPLFEEVITISDTTPNTRFLTVEDEAIYLDFVEVITGGAYPVKQWLAYPVAYPVAGV